MKRLLQSRLRLPLLLLMIFAACAGSGDDGVAPLTDDAGTPEAIVPDGGGDSPDALDVDAQALRCSGEFCIVDLPNSRAYGFTKWMFAGVQIDPVIGVWAIANGVLGADESTAQMLRFENGAWRPTYAPALGSGAGKRSVRLSSLAADGAGKLVAVGSTIDDGTTVVVRGDGTTFTTTSFDGALSAVWFAEVGQVWAAGSRGSIFRSLNDGGWVSESSDAGGEFVSVWGSGPNDVYVGGVSGVDPAELPAYGYLGHRTVDDAGAKKWTFSTFEELQQYRSGEYTIVAGVAPPEGPRFWVSPAVIARTALDGGHEEWVADSFEPRAAIRALWARGKDDIWAAGQVGRLFHFDGAGWSDSLLFFNGAPLTSNLTGIAGTSAGEIFVVGEGVALRRQAQ